MPRRGGSRAGRGARYGQGLTNEVRELIFNDAATTADEVKRDRLLAKGEKRVAGRSMNGWGEPLQDLEAARLVSPSARHDEQEAGGLGPQDEAYWLAGNLAVSRASLPAEHGWPTDVDPAAPA